ncbi:MAG: energy transducer TonB [Proteobacteria bacterium]|nr:energy transducer TonB [Pseudomonadota bacterium]
MLVRATRTVSTWILRALFYAALFLAVVTAHLGLTTALRQHGLNGSLSLLVSGALVLAAVLALIQVVVWLRRWLREQRERTRARLKLPVGPTCLIWKPNSELAQTSPMPWETIGPMRARYPSLPRRLGIEGYVIVEFEVGANGGAKNIHLVDAWPSDVFFKSAKEALQQARFQPSLDEHVRYGASYRMPFVFRLPGSSKLAEKGARAKTLRPIWHATQRFVENVSARIAEARTRR